jgi:hypothetical protein
MFKGVPQTIARCLARRHIDAALYDFNPPKVTTLMALKVPDGPDQVREGEGR